MDELYVLERQEAFRRAEYEARHADALRRAKTRIHSAATSPVDPHPRHRISKSATTSPIMRNAKVLATTPTDDRNRSFFGLNEHDWPAQAPPHLASSSSRPSAEDLLMDRDSPIASRAGSKRRLSGPAWMAPPPPQHEPPLPQSRSSGHLVETMRGPGGGGHHTWNHPYHHPHQYRRGAHATHHHDESPSPISSDSEPLPPAHERASSYVSQSPPRIFHLHGGAPRSHHQHTIDTNSPPHYSSAVRTTTSDFAFTPSTSPFLGPLRTLNIHSANPSRAPSPILLPPPSRSFDLSTRDAVYLAGEEQTVHPRPGAGSIYGSPPSNLFMRGVGGKSQQGHVQRRSDGLYSSPFHGPSHGHGYGAGSQIPTPQLSSGPSSNGSSPGSLAHGISSHAAYHPYQPPSAIASVYTPHGGGSGSGSGTLSASSSRAPSPLHWSRGGGGGSPPSASSVTSSFSHHERERERGQGSQPQHHLAHSVRMAFGMTPIHHSVPPSRRSSPPLPSSGHGNGTGVLPRNTSWSASTGPFSFGSHQSQYQQQHAQAYLYSQQQQGYSAAASMPGSRSGSPPIRLPPLKAALEGEEGLGLKLEDGPDKMKMDVEEEGGLQQLTVDGKEERKLDVKEGVDREKDIKPIASGKGKVELPGFSQFEAAARSGHPISIPIHAPLSPLALLPLSPSAATTSSTPSALTLSLAAASSAASHAVTTTAPDSRMSIDFVR
ncbi:hypothetical protein GALMADRAFT_854216 [Galerina marginata CBS 339.88]|uniref:Uncharacterized protein n=1 Tax=Galerina marginata (strain CBS 339.88) TaxID=685588 RepID=A0A067TI81_GALM3|nr:hypothetical protein GALMADRAFT_854216 [Galerina marginata CBS 339.88]